MTKVQRRIKQIEAEKATEKDIVDFLKAILYAILFYMFLWFVLAI